MLYWLRSRQKRVTRLRDWNGFWPLNTSGLMIFIVRRESSLLAELELVDIKRPAFSLVVRREGSPFAGLEQMHHQVVTVRSGGQKRESLDCGIGTIMLAPVLAGRAGSEEREARKRDWNNKQRVTGSNRVSDLWSEERVARWRDWNSNA